MKSVTRPGRAATATLTGAAGIWLASALAGQWAFLSYIVVFYGPSTFTGDFAAWARNGLVFKGYVASDLAGNLTFAAHALAAGVIAFGGALQLIPWVRSRLPRFHRWNGRLFLVTAVGLSLSGFYLVWVRGSNPDLLGQIATTTNGVLILSCAVMAWRTAVRRDFVVHRRWAMRLYLVSNAQWFTRVGFILWIMINGGPVALKAFHDVWQFGCYLLPLAVLELYLRVRERGGDRANFAMAGLLLALTLLMIGGMVGFSLFSLRIIKGEMA